MENLKDWNPALYLKFENERTRPAMELLARINHPLAKTYTDIGCGPGNSTALLYALAPEAEITGLDNSPEMLARARENLPACQFENADIATWQPANKQDVIFANASMQWIPNHQHVFPHLVQQLAEKGVLAVQMPDNWGEHTHTLMRQVAAEFDCADSDREALLTINEYYDLLTNAGCDVDIWRTTYFHVMPSIQAIVDWRSGSGMRLYLQALTSQQRERFLERYSILLNEHYPAQADGNRVMAFPRLFIVARKK